MYKKTHNSRIFVREDMVYIMNCPVAMQNDGDEMIQQHRNWHLEKSVNYKRTIKKNPQRFWSLFTPFTPFLVQSLYET